ncbi:MAG: M23 family metallopeptidase [Proteobacteria bacterium]|nr:M23 family metallopeptidase [Pseudomonadota bacterium]
MEPRRFILGLAAACVISAISGCAHEPIAPFKLKGVWHTVSSGDTVSSVSNRYGTDSEALAELNDLPSSGSLEGREEIFIPKKDGKPPGTGAPPQTAVSAVGSIPQEPYRNGKSPGTKGQCGQNGKPCFAWPVKGKVASPFGPRSNSHHDGIDISAKQGTPVSSAADGKVLYSGNEIKGYGNLIIIRHQGGIITIYAHNDKNLIKEGAAVKSGQTIARVGNSGSTKGMYLHFEVRINEQPQNPLLYLPSR